MQHIEYKEQLKIKQSIIKQALNKYTKLKTDEVDLRKTKGMDYYYKYRNRSQMPFRNANFGLVLGFYKPESNLFVHVEECMIHHDTINKINSLVLKVLRKHNIKAYDSKNRDGILFFLVTRFLEKTNSASVTFVVNNSTEGLRKVSKEIMEQMPVIKSVSYTISDTNSNLIVSDKIHMLAGETWIEDKFGDLKVKISPDAFHQLNTSQMEVMYDLVLETANLQPNSIVFDLYSGIGITSILLSKHVKKVYGIDFSKASIKDAIENAKINNIDNVEFIKGKVEIAMPNLIKSGVKPNLVLLDPPRKGLSLPVIQALLKSLPKEIIYISCNPSTLAKNINELNMKYDVVSIQPIDMFPNTASVESITLLKLK